MIKKTFIAILLLITTLFLIKCAIPEDFTGLSWNSNFNIPLINKTYNIFDLEDDSHFVVEDDDIYLIYYDELESDVAASEIKINPKTTAEVPVSAIDTGTLIPLYIDESGIDLEDIDLISGILEQGIFQIELIDPRPELEELLITFLDFYDQEGLPFQITIDDFTTPIHCYDLSGYSVGDPDGDEVMDYLMFYVQTESQVFFPDMVYIRIFFDEPIYFEFFRGHLSNKKIRLDDKILDNDLNFPINISNAMEFEEASLEMTFNNEFGFDTQFVGTLTGFNDKDHKTYSLLITQHDQVIFNIAEEPGLPITTTVTISKPEVTELINIFPELLQIEDSHLVLQNLDQTPGFAQAADKNTGSFSITAASTFTVFNETITPDEIFSIEITESNREYLEKYPEMIYLSVTLENTIPVGMNIDLYFSEVSDSLYIFDPTTYSEFQTLKFPDNYVAAALIESQPVTNDVRFTMEREDIDLFLNETVYFAMKITFDESDGAVTVLPHHYLMVIARMDINLNIEIDS